MPKQNAKRISSTIHESENYLHRQHNVISGFDTIDDFVVNGETSIDNNTYRGCLHHFMQIRTGLARALWTSECYIGISLLDDLVFQLAKASNKRIYRDAIDYVRNSNVMEAGFVLYPLHGFGVQMPGRLERKSSLSPYITFKKLGVCLTCQHHSLPSAYRSVTRMASTLGVHGRISRDSFQHYFKSRNLEWLARNPLMMISMVSHTGDYYENQFVYTLKIRISTALSAMIYAISVDKGYAVDDFVSTARVNNNQTLDIRHYLVGEMRKSKKKTYVELRCVPMNLAPIDLARLSDLSITLSSDTLRKKSIARLRRELGAILKDVESGYITHVNTNSSNLVKRRVYARIVTALDWFRYSFGGRATSDETIVNLAVAFETLLTDRYGKGVLTRVKRRVGICLKGKRAVQRYIGAVESIMHARGEILHTGSTVKKADVDKARSAFVFCVIHLGGKMGQLGSSLDQPIGRVLGDV